MIEQRYKLLVTGATGFVGSRLMTKLGRCDDFIVIPCIRFSSSLICNFPRAEYIDEISPFTDWSSILVNIDSIVHVAGRAHIPSDKTLDVLDEYCKVNVGGTLNLGRQAAAAGVKRFVYISSIGVNGNINDHPFIADDQPNPVEPYALSKWEAEQGLWQIQQESGMEVVIIRPPLVYGPGAPGSFGSLVRWVEKGVPLPLGAIHNKRSLVGIDNLVDLIIRCIDHPAAANQVFLAGDGEDLSTTELLRSVGKAMGKPARLIPVPVGLLQFGATLLGKKAMAQRLLGSLQVDISKTCELLDWQPPYTVEEGLRRCFEPVD
ncbi:UDP-glucose 4-epimerase family protein [Stutzerimonas stutzeri]|uniref:UDP-glucose 4-epimerase family protein n=2 Tax=Stutzerimonas stutzeri TaxID=316 RepID=UPI0009B682A4|nr:SDR family oxidoreductase [Stutzerimonas stutzeri]MCW8159134.1 SDR family oxidoreductase [Stutzerimonas stutzeri]QPT30638.1 SDR family oxidoreductase [Stutzerimonas stutzeri]